MFKKLFKAAVVFSIAITVVSCSDGENGLSGSDGADGINGLRGNDGSNALGYDDLTAYGSIISEISGTRIDGEAFTDITDYKYTSTYYYDEERSVNEVVKIDGDLEFEVQRFFANPDDVHQEDFLNINLYVTDAGLESQSFDFEFEVNNHAIIGEDLKFFRFDETYNYDDVGVTNFSISNYSFDDTTKKLQLSYSFDVSGAENITGNNMSISGEVDVIVFELVAGVDL